MRFGDINLSLSLPAPGANEVHCMARRAVYHVCLTVEKYMGGIVR